MSERINLRSYLKDDCEFVGCYFNRDGECLCDSEDFTKERLEGIKRDITSAGEIPIEADFECNEAEPEIGKCLYCGSDLVMDVEENGEENWYCSVCDEGVVY